MNTKGELRTRTKEKEHRNEGPVIMSKNNVLIIAKLTEEETEQIIEQLFSKKSISQ